MAGPGKKENASWMELKQTVFRLESKSDRSMQRL
jgi:hypothetical protein